MILGTLVIDIIHRYLMILGTLIIDIFKKIFDDTWHFDYHPNTLPPLFTS